MNLSVFLFFPKKDALFSVDQHSLIVFLCVSKLFFERLIDSLRNYWWVVFLPALFHIQGTWQGPKPAKILNPTEEVTYRNVCHDCQIVKFMCDLGLSGNSATNTRTIILKILEQILETPLFVQATEAIQNS